jgi:hypothetical protein
MLEFETKERVNSTIDFKEWFIESFNAFPTSIERALSSSMTNEYQQLFC